MIPPRRVFRLIGLIGVLLVVLGLSNEPSPILIVLGVGAMIGGFGIYLLYDDGRYPDPSDR